MLKKFIKFLKCIIGLFCLIECIGFFIMLCENYHEQYFSWIFGTLFFGFLTFFSFKRPRKGKNITSQFPTETLQATKNNYPKSNIHYLIKKKGKNITSQFPTETLQAIKNSYPKSNIHYLIKQVKESVVLIETTTNIETLLSRREYVLQQCYTLKELEDCGLYNGNFSPQECINKLVSNLNIHLKRCYDDYYFKAQQLKTETGVQNRMEKFWIIMNNYLDEYAILDFKELIK